MKAQLFMVTYVKDLRWLECSLRSVQKYWQSDFPTVIIANEDSRGQLPSIVAELQCVVHFVNQWSDGRRDQIYLKMMADRYLDPAASMVMFLDSDCLFSQLVTEESCCDENGRPFVRMRLYESAFREGINGQRLNEVEIWAYKGYQTAVQESLTGSPVHYEYMQAMPYLFYKETIQKTRETIERRTGKSLKEVMNGYHSSCFSEFNLFGAYAHVYEPDRYRFLLPEEYGPKCVREFHSWTQSPEDQSAAIEFILK